MVTVAADADDTGSTVAATVGTTSRTARQRHGRGLRRCLTTCTDMRAPSFAETGHADASGAAPAAGSPTRARRASVPAGPRAVRRIFARSAPAVLAAQPGGDGVEPPPVEDGALAADAALRHLEHPVEAHPARPVLVVPRAAAQGEPVALAVARAGAGQHQAEQVPPVPADHQHGAVLALVRVLLEGDPGPH